MDKDKSVDELLKEELIRERRIRKIGRVVILIGFAISVFIMFYACHLSRSFR